MTAGDWLVRVASVAGVLVALFGAALVGSLVERHAVNVRAREIHTVDRPAAGGAPHVQLAALREEVAALRRCVDDRDQTLLSAAADLQAVLASLTGAGRPRAP